MSQLSLDIPKYKNGRAVHIGRDLAYQLRSTTAAQRAVIAAEDGDGHLLILKPTNAQRAKLFNVSPQTLAAARTLPPAERDKVKHGLRKLVEPKDRVKAALRGIRTDDDVKDLIIEVGADRILHVLDQLTGPQLVAAE